jgi:hypothetical protein
VASSCTRIHQPDGRNPSASTAPIALFRSATMSTPVPATTTLEAATAAGPMAVGQVAGALVPKKMAASIV